MKLEDIPEIKFKTDRDMKERTIKVVKDDIFKKIGLINTKTNKTFPLPEGEIDAIMEEIKELR